MCILHSSVISMYICILGKLTILESLVLHGNDINGPAPLSLKDLSHLREFICFHHYPSECFQPKRRFNRKEFEKVYVNGPKIKLDNVHWENEVLYGDTVPGSTSAGSGTGSGGGVRPSSKSHNTYVSAIEPVTFRTAYKYAIPKSVHGIDVEAYGNYKPRFRLKLQSDARKERYTVKEDG